MKAESRYKKKLITESCFHLHKILDSVDWYFVALINSEFISLYVDNFINNTSHFQINDARQLPIIIPQKETFESLQKLVADCISLKKAVTTDDFLMGEKQYELDRLVRLLYGVED